MVFAAIRKSLSLKVSITLAVITVALTTIAAAIIINRQTRSMEELTMDKAKMSAQLGAKTYGRLLEDGVDNNYLTVQDVFDKNYMEIKGYNWNGVPRYHTKYDSYTDNVMVAFLDRFLASDDILAAIAEDTNGYVPTHNSKYMQPFTGDATKDVANNRSKRMFKDEVALKAGKSEEAVLTQPYHRDTGELAWDVSSPINVKGKHWGAFRVIVSSAQIDKKRTELIWGLVGMFTAFALVTALLIFGMLRQSMKPLVKLTNLAEEISLGEGLENPIKPQTIDEIGMMTKAVDRLRSSLKAAMARLGE